MSVKVMTLIWERFPHGKGRLLTMVSLADIGNDDGGSIYPGIEWIALKTRNSEKQAMRIMASLIRDGWLIDLQEGETKQGRRIATERYLINIEKVMKCPVILKRKQKRTLAPRKGTSGTGNGTFPAGKGDMNSAESERVSHFLRDPFYPYNHLNDGDPAALRGWIEQLETYLVKAPRAQFAKIELERAQQCLADMVSGRDGSAN